MAVFDTTRVVWTYTTDQGVAIPYRAVGGYTSQSATLGGAAFTPPVPEPKRYGLKPRCAIVPVAGHTTVRRRVPVFDNAAYAAIVPGTTTVTVNYQGQGVLSTVESLEGERHRGAGLAG
jgi:hypothetical protein